MQKKFFAALTRLLLFIFLCTPFIAYLPPTFKAKAENTPPKKGDYACVNGADVFFYGVPDEKDGLFLLPSTYYVRLLDYSADFCRVEYQTDGTDTKRLVGYVKTEQINFIPYVPKQPYPYCIFDVEYKIDDSAQTADGFLTQIKMSCLYYGDYNVGSSTYCYVLREGEFGYIPKPYDLHIEKNTEYAEYLETLQSAPIEKTENEGKSNSPAQIAILVALCLLVPLLAALILKPKSTPDPD